MRSLLFALVLAVGPSPFAPIQSTVAGEWVLTFNTPGGTREATAVFKVDGEKLTGTMSSAEAGDTPFTGTVKGNTFTLMMQVTTANGTFSIGMAGEIDGDAMKGTMDYGQGNGDFTGKRKN